MARQERCSHAPALRVDECGEILERLWSVAESVKQQHPMAPIRDEIDGRRPCDDPVRLKR
jgi:hypothetical protein